MMRDDPWGDQFLGQKGQKSRAKFDPPDCWVCGVWYVREVRCSLMTSTRETT